MFSTFFCSRIQAQLGFCSGNSGSPIFTETFGTGVTNSSLPFGTTTYSFSNGEPNDGFYTVSSNTAYFDWFNISDHTLNDTNGKMLIVNSDVAAGEFYRTGINGLCENTTYEFSSWVLNLSPLNGFCGSAVIPINVRFEIWDNSNKNLLASGSTGNIISTSSPVWNQYALVFQTLPGQTSVILKMINNGAGGCGNDLAIDDIVFKSCGDRIIVEDPSNDNSASVCSLDTPYSTILTAIPDNTVFSSHFYQWQNSLDGIIWTDIIGETNQSVSISGVSNTTYYRTKVSESMINVNNDLCNTLSDEFIITVNNPTTPTFNPVSDICDGDALAALPTMSIEGITGTWSPTLDNTTTTTYTFVPDSNQCAINQTMTIVVNPIVTPTFNQVSAICEGDSLAALPTMSNEGIIGVWSPSLNNAATTTYTFVPNSGQCAVNQTMTIAVNPILTPTFNQISPICFGAIITPLPTVSNEGITGSWSPSLDNTITTTYTFVPNSGVCVTNQTMTVEVNPTVTPTFNQVPPICNGDFLGPLPTTSLEGIMGVWSPMLDNTVTTTYTFTPNFGECAINQIMTIVVNPNSSPTFNPVSAICNGDILSPLPTSSIEGITGTWSPVLDNTVTTTYTFTPDPGFCPLPVNLTIEVFENPVFTLQDEYFLCFDINGVLVIPTTLNTGLNTADYNFTWLLNGVAISGANQGSYNPIEEGRYEVIVQNSMTLCETRMLTDVVVLYEPDFEANVITDAFSENQTIEVTVFNIGDFEYQLDGGPWQDAPIFSNVTLGEHLVTVRDKRGCIEASETIVVMDYPKYFTPNGDGFHDTWNITAPRNPLDYLALSRVRIFDRYGKLLKEIDPTGNGWNGIYNGSLMHSDDYWFVVEYIEPRTGEPKTFRSNFSLKR